MSIEVLPLGMRCNIGCTYCYQEPVRAQGNAGHPKYDMKAMKAALLKEGYRFTVFGGEPLLMPLDDLEELWRWGMQQFGEQARKDGHPANGVQTNGTLITEAHIRLFRKYDVGVGLSIDGPGELNDARAATARSVLTPEEMAQETRELTAKSLKALDRLLEEGMHPSLIVTLHALNIRPARLPRLLDWFRELAGKGLRHVNLHLLERDTPEAHNALSVTEDEAVEALLACGRLMAETGLRFLPLTDMEHLLRGEDQWGEPRTKGGRLPEGASCIWHSCDPYTTEAVRGVDGQGNRRNCGRTYKEGVQYLKADTAGYERYLALYHTPQAMGGCAGCRFFFACKGQCPGTAEKGDWRGRTEHCRALIRVFEVIEAGLLRQGIQPFSLTNARSSVESWMVKAWSEGKRTSVTAALAAAKGEARDGEVAGAEGDVPHGDAPHGDVPHGDHDDAARPVITHGDHTDVAQGGGLWQTL